MEYSMCTALKRFKSTAAIALQNNLSKKKGEKKEKRRSGCPWSEMLWCLAHWHKAWSDDNCRVDHEHTIFTKPVYTWVCSKNAA